MNAKRSLLFVTVGTALLLGSLWWAQAERQPAAKEDDPAYFQTIHDTMAMVFDQDAQHLAGRYGLQILPVTWEDTGRYKDSSVGPNISDMTIQVGATDLDTRQFKVMCMPVIRYPNFSDKTCDLDPRDFTLLVGNHIGDWLKRISLLDFLANPKAYLSRPETWKGREKSLLALRDGKVLVSAQACFLPIPKNGKATFNPVLFNYQSYAGDPAVLTVLVTREGTSVTIIDNKRDAFKIGPKWGQRLFHNQDGKRTSLTGQRLSDFQAANPSASQPNAIAKSDPQSGLNVVLLIQIPLKQKKPLKFNTYTDYELEPFKDLDRGAPDIEEAVIGHGKIEGPFTEIGNLAIERDRRFPVRVTVQFYKATSNGVITEADLRTIKEQIDRVYAQSDSVGSLVTGGETGRATEYMGMKVQPPDWWIRFWERHRSNTGDSPDEAKRKLRELLGENYQARPVCDLYLRNLLRKRY